MAGATLGIKIECDIRQVRQRWSGWPFTFAQAD